MNIIDKIRISLDNPHDNSKKYEIANDAITLKMVSVAGVLTGLFIGTVGIGSVVSKNPLGKFIVIGGLSLTVLSFDAFTVSTLVEKIMVDSITDAKEKTPTAEELVRNSMNNTWILGPTLSPWLIDELKK